MQAAYAAFFLAETPLVLGRRLLPLTLGHAALLDALGSPYIRGGQADASDMCLAVWVCSRPWRDCVDAIRNGGVPTNELGQWGREWVSSIASGDGEAEDATRLRDYLDQWTAAPRRAGGSVEPVRSHWAWLLAHRLIGGDYSAQRRADVWEMLLPEAMALVAAAGDANGDSSLLTDDMAAKVDAARAKRRAAREAKPPTNEG